MALIVVTIDTKAETLSATIDGAEVPNLYSVSAYRYKEYGSDEEEVSVSLNSSEKVGDTTKTQTIYATVINDGIKTLSASRDNKTNLKKDLSSFFRKD
jgi:hypothetical protein